MGTEWNVNTAQKVAGRQFFGPPNTRTHTYKNCKPAAVNIRTYTERHRSNPATPNERKNKLAYLSKRAIEESGVVSIWGHRIFQDL